MRKRFYCPSCKRVLSDEEIEIKRELRKVYMVRLNVAGLVEPIYFYLNELMDVISASAIGVKSNEKLIGMNAILPISGRKVKIFKAENVARPEIFSKANFFSFSLKKDDIDAKIERIYENNREKLISDLKINGAYVEVAEQEIDVYKCKYCGSELKAMLNEEIIAICESSEDKKMEFTLNSYSDIHSVNKSLSFNLFECSKCGFLTFDKEEKCPKCGDKLNRLTLFYEDALLNYIFPFKLGEDIRFLVCNEIEKNKLLDNFHFFSSLYEKEIKIGNVVTYNNYSVRKGRIGFANLNKTEYGQKIDYLLRFILSSANFNYYSNLLNGITSILKRWKVFFSKNRQEILDNTELRTDFYIEQYLLALSEKLILEQKKSIDKGDIFSYLQNICDILEEANFWVYPYLKNIKFTEYVHVFKAVKYFYDTVEKYLLPFLKNENKEKFVTYREDFYFEDVLKIDTSLKNLIEEIIEWKKFFMYKDNEKLVVMIKPYNNTFYEKIKLRMKYIVTLLNLEKITFLSETESPDFALGIEIEAGMLYFPVVSKSNLEKTIALLKNEIEEKNRIILEKRYLLLDFDFFSKAPYEIVEEEEKKVEKLIFEKMRLKKYLDIIDTYVGRYNEV